MITLVSRIATSYDEALRLVNTVGHGYKCNIRKIGMSKYKVTCVKEVFSAPLVKPSSFGVGIKKGKKIESFPPTLVGQLHAENYRNRLSIKNSNKVYKVRYVDVPHPSYSVYEYSK